MLFIPTLFLFFSFCAKLKISSHPIPAVYRGNNRTAKFPTLHSQLLIIKNRGHKIEEPMCIYISLAERSVLNEWAHIFSSLKVPMACDSSSGRSIPNTEVPGYENITQRRNSWIHTNATKALLTAKITNSFINLSASCSFNCFGLKTIWKIRKK